jgi:predicted kinase
LAELARRVVRAGHSAVVDAVHGRPHERDAIERVAQDAGVAFEGVWLEAALDVRVARVGGRMGDASDADGRVAAQQEAIDVGAVGWARIDANANLGEITDAVRRMLS